MQLSLWLESKDIGKEIQLSLEALVDQVLKSVEGTMDLQDREEYHVILASDSLIQQLNKDYRNKDYLTDVLSFPLGPDGEVTGEIYICWSRVISQADEYGHSWQREFCYLLVHGILHLLGYEHSDEPNPEMRGMEEKILQRMEMGR